MLELSAPFWFSFIIVLIVVFIINYISQTYLMKKKEHKIIWKSAAILFAQSLAITIILEII
ncbi:hypothetical protein GLV94_08700 [Virgibacillus halodenitrificans]|uniref:hypothetical protein n=1 Tax=Virgibacillus halodenitrificans TaxID=1482 RepID=UPI00136D7283|nr:hypothetical protein [Virgibacillus halodenitrificans]MYL45725.1 hypothetical protein [Virgibacillus halodenitrificans]